jgi:hypothetical protein
MVAKTDCCPLRRSADTIWGSTWDDRVNCRGSGLGTVSPPAETCTLKEATVEHELAPAPALGCRTAEASRQEREQTRGRGATCDDRVSARTAPLGGRRIVRRLPKSLGPSCRRTLDSTWSRLASKRVDIHALEPPAGGCFCDPSPPELGCRLRSWCRAAEETAARSRGKDASGRVVQRHQP